MLCSLRSVMQERLERSLKFVPPGPPTGFVYRPRLGQALARGLAGQLVLLLAPDGYGKTSLLASMARDWDRFSRASPARHLAWFQLDPSDDDPALFMEGLVESLQRVLPGFGKVTRAALEGTSDVGSQIRHLMSVLVDELRGTQDTPVVVVLDDFHLLQNRATVESLEQSLRDPGSPIRLIVSTRTDPRFYLSILRSRDAVVELRAEDLGFTLKEARELVSQRVRQPVSEVEAERLLRDVKGWPSAVNLVALALSRGGSRLSLGKLAPTEHNYRRLVAEVVDRLPDDTKEGVLRTSLLRYLDEASLREGAGLSNAAEVLRLVEEMGLPVLKPAGIEAPLRYEPLFRAALEQELASLLLPNEYRAARARVAAYSAARGAWDDAIRGYLEAGAHEEAAVAVEQAADAELSSGHLDTVLRWIRLLPGPTRQRHPRLMVCEAKALASKNRWDESRALLVAARRELESSEDQEGLGRQQSAWAAVQLADGRCAEARRSALESLAWLAEDDYAERAEVHWLLARTLDLMGDLPGAFSAAGQGLLAAERSGQPTLAVRAMLQLGRLAYLRGSYSTSLGLSGRAVHRLALAGKELLALSMAGATAASVYLERDQVQAALTVATGALEASRRLHDVAGQVRAGLALAMGNERLGQLELAGERMGEASALALRLPPNRPERAMALQAAAASLFRLGRRREGLERARHALQAASSSSHASVADQCRLMLAAGEMAGLKTVPSLLRIRRLSDRFREGDSRRWLSASLQLLAQGSSRLRLTRYARARLEECLSLSIGEGYVGLPLGFPSERDRLFELAVREGVSPEVAAGVLGIDEETGKRVLLPLLAHKEPRIRSRAERAAKALEKETAGAPRPLLVWPGLEGEEKPASKVSLLALGGLQALVDGQAVEWPSPDAQRLAAYLLVNRGRSRLRDDVLRDLWPSDEPSAANLRLQEALYAIRESLGTGYPAVDLAMEAEGVYRWRGDGCSIDVEAFQTRLDRASELVEAEGARRLEPEAVSLLEGAVELYRGEFLAGFDFDWCVPTRRDLHGRLLWATRLLVDHHMSTGGWRKAIQYGLQSLRSDPLQEDMVRNMMLCYYRIGDRDGVLQQYRQVKRLLAKERGEWPSDETRQLRVKLLGR